MLIDLKELVEKEDSALDRDISFEAETLKNGRQEYKVKESNIHLTLTNIGHHIISCVLSGTVTLLVPCDRCLDEIDYTSEVSFKKDIQLEKIEEIQKHTPDELVFIEDNVLNTDVLIKNEILADFPMKFLCKEDCKGICEECGKNLNDGPCDCENKPRDPRMAKILELYNESQDD